MRKSDKHPFLSAQQERLSRHLVQVVLPAFGTLYFALSTGLGFPGGAEVIFATSAIGAFLGTALGLNSRRIPDSGEILIEETEDGVDLQRISLDATPSELAKMREVRFKVTPPS